MVARNARGERIDAGSGSIQTCRKASAARSSALWLQPVW
ncbi:Uncharacterised protein [Acinetobacter baumannii]|nr:Uncharacterised protein [Acinetobacter baumannii]